MTTSFAFNKFDPGQKDQDLILQGDATITETNVLQLTDVDKNGNPRGQSVGRVLYFAPVHLYDSSALVASFETTFTFRVSVPASNHRPGDGLAFFIAKPETTIPDGSEGKLLGLFTDPSDKVVAVEFDTFPNFRDDEVKDPDYMHIGININSIKSSVTSKWDWQNGGTATAHISYNSVSRRLSAVCSYPKTSPVTVGYEVNLSNILPEWVRVGFSASTGHHSQTNNILSWSFRSSLMWNNVVEEQR